MPVVLLVFLAGTGKESDAVVLATVGGEPITDTSVFTLAVTRSLLRGIPYRDPALVRTLVDDIVLDALVALEARRVDLDHEYAFRMRALLEITNHALSLQATETLLPGVAIDSAQVDSFYHANIARYTVPRPQRWVRQITVYKPGHGLPEQYGKRVDSLYDGWDPKRKIDSIYTRLASGENFTALALAHSEELSVRETGGDLGWVSELTIHEKPLRDWILSLPPNLISKPFETDFGWHIAQVRALRDAGPAPMDARIEADIRQALLLELAQKAAARIRDSVLAAATIDYNDEALARPDSEIQQGTVIATVNGRDTLWGAAYFMQKTVRSAGQPVDFDAAQKREVVRPMLEMLCLQQWLRSEGFLDRPEVLATAAKLREHHAKSIVYSRFDAADVQPDSAEIMAYYKSHITEFTPERRHKIQLRRFTDRGEADSIATQWKSGTIGVSETQWVGPDDLPANVWNRIAAVPAGTVVGPIPSNAEFLVVRLDQIAPPKPFHEARSGIGNLLRESKRAKLRDAFVKEATRKYGVQKFVERMNSVEFPSYADYEAAAKANSAQVTSAGAE